MRPRGAAEVDEVRVRVGRAGLDCRTERFGSGIRLTLDASGGSRFAATLELRHQVGLSVTETGPFSIPAAAGPGVVHFSFLPPGRHRPAYDRHRDDLVERAVAFALRAAGLPADVPPPPELERFLARAVRAARACCDHEALAVAGRFHPVSRLHVYRHVLADDSRRVRQLADTCPGFLVLTAGLDALGEDVGDLLQGIEDGRRLSPLLTVGAATLLLRLHQPPESGPGSGEDEHWSALTASRNSGTVEAWTQRLSLLAGRVGPRASPFDLCGFPPPIVVPEDIPREPRANARWFAAIRSACDASLREEVPDEAWAFLSRSAGPLTDLALDAAVGPWSGQPVRTAGVDLARAVLERGIATGRWPCRRSEPGSVVEDVQEWARQRRCRRAMTRGLGDLLERVRVLDLGEVASVEVLDQGLHGREASELVFPDFDGPNVTVAQVDLRPVRTAVALSAEGRRMENCVATWCDKLLEGGRWLFAGNVLALPATVEVRRIRSGYVIEQAQGLRNQALTDAQRDSLMLWLEALNGGQVLPVRPSIRAGRNPPAEEQLALPLAAPTDGTGG